MIILENRNFENVKWYFRFCCYIRDYYAKTEGIGSGEVFGAFLVSTGLLFFNIFTIILVITFFLFDNDVLPDNAYLTVIPSMFLIGLLNYIITFKGNRYKRYCDERISGYQASLFIAITIISSVIVIWLHRNRNIEEKERAMILRLEQKIKQ